MSAARSGDGPRGPSGSPERITYHLYVQNLDAGGAQPVMVSLANAMAARGLTVTLLANNVRGPWKASVAPAVKLVDLEAADSANAIWKLVQYLGAHRPQIMLSALAHSNVSALVATMIRRVGTKLIIAEHNTTSRWLADQRWSRKLLFGTLLPLLYPRAKAIVCVSHEAAEDLAGVLGVPPDRLTVIFNASPDARQLEGLERPRHRWLEDRSVPVVVAAGRLTSQKDYPTLLQAFARARSERPMRLLVLGDGPARGEIEEIIRRLGLSDTVHLAGYVPSILPFLLHADLFVLSSRFEGFPLVLVEALSCGLPIVSTDCESGPREILKAGALGRLVPVGDSVALARGMLDALISPGDAEARRSRAREYSLDAMVSSYVALMQRVTDRNNSL